MRRHDAGIVVGDPSDAGPPERDVATVGADRWVERLLGGVAGEQYVDHLGGSRLPVAPVDVRCSSTAADLGREDAGRLEHDVATVGADVRILGGVVVSR